MTTVSKVFPEQTNEEPVEGTISFIGLNGTTEDNIPVSREECLTLDTFHALINLYEGHGKKLIIARVKSWDHQDVKKFHYSYYCGFQLNKALFRSKGADIVSRYHKTSPIITLNPLTNEDIVGEVVYFIVNQPHTNGVVEKDESNPSKENQTEPSIIPPETAQKVEQIQVSPSLQADNITRVIVDGSQEASSSTKTPECMSPPNLVEETNVPVKAQQGTPSNIRIGLTNDRVASYIGTDYHYIFSESLRKIFMENSIDNDCQLIPSMSNQINQHPHADGPVENEVVSLVNRIRRAYGRQRQGSLIYVPYARAVLFGISISLYFTFCVVVLATAVKNLRHGGTEKEPSIWIWSFLPFFVFLVDRYSITIAEGSESRMMVMIKLVASGLYIFLPDFMFHRYNSDYHLSRNIINTIAPCVALCYSRYLYTQSTRGKHLI